MKPQADINFQRVAEAIEYIQLHFKEQPSLEDIADNVHVSPYHFQRIFSDWAGTSPKKFLQYISLQYAKDLLKQNATLAEGSIRNRSFRNRKITRSVYQHRRYDSF